MILTLACCVGAAYASSVYRKRQTTYYYEQLAEYMTPVSPRDGTLPLDEISKYLKSHSADISYLNDVLHHEDPWRRWTAAKTMGEYGNADCVGLLDERLEIEEIDYVRTRIVEAIERLTNVHRLPTEGNGG